MRDYREFPSVVELTSYVFCFHGLMCGPFCFYKDYIAFIDGSNYDRLDAATTAAGNGVSNCRGGGGDGRTLSTGSQHLSLRDDAVSDARSGNNSHRGRLAAPPAPGVLHSPRLPVSIIYSTRTRLAPSGIGSSCCCIIMLQYCIERNDINPSYS